MNTNVVPFVRLTGLMMNIEAIGQRKKKQKALQPSSFPTFSMI